MTLKVELGGGTSGRPGYVNIDRLPGADVVCDFNRPLPLDDDQVDDLYSAHCLEHVPSINLLLSEIARICRAGANVEIRVPHWLRETAMLPGHVHTLPERFWRMVTSEDHRRHWFPGTKRLDLQSVHYEPDVEIREAQALFPQATPEQLKRFIPNCCHEVWFRFTVVEYADAADVAAMPFRALRPNDTDTCILVSKGPSANCAPPSATAETVATINEAAVSVSGNIAIGVFYDAESLLAARPAWDRIGTFVLPKMVHVKGGLRLQQPAEIDGLPCERIVNFRPAPCGHDAATIEAALLDSQRSGRVASCTTSLAALSVLSLAGFKRVECFGFDLDRETPDIYRTINEGLRTAAPLFERIFGMRISFYGESE